MLQTRAIHEMWNAPQDQAQIKDWIFLKLWINKREKSVEQ
jgi:hypothetical protein